MIRASAPAKINLALVVGPKRGDGLHEVATVMQRVELADTLSLEPAASLEVEGFAGDTIVRRALELVAERVGVTPGWRVRIDKAIPVAAGLGGGSSDAATALRLANEHLGTPLSDHDLYEIACSLGADVPFFLAPGAQLATGSGRDLEPLDLPRDYEVLIVLPDGEEKSATADIYARFDGAVGFAARRERILEIVDAGRSADLAALPPNDLASSPLAARLIELGAFRADVSGAGPSVFGLFRSRSDLEAAAEALSSVGRVWLTKPAWYV